MLGAGHINHISGYALYQTIKGKKRILCMFLTMFTRINVPVFFMISGALLLGKQEDYRTVFKKRVVRMLLLIAFAETAFYSAVWIKANLIKHGSTPFNIGELLRGIVSGDAGPTAYWFLYSYLGMLLLLPILQRIARGITKQDVLVLFGLRFLFGSFMPLINLILSMLSLEGISLHSKFVVPLATSSIYFYPLMGYYLDHHVDIRSLSSKTLWAILLAALLGIAASSACTYYQGVTEGKFTQDYVKLFDYLTAIAVFLLVKRLMVVEGHRLSEGKIGAVICFVGSLTLGMYVFDPIFRKLFIKGSWFSDYHLSTLLTSFGWIVASMTAGGLLTWLLKFVPGLKKIL